MNRRDALVIVAFSLAGFSALVHLVLGAIGVGTSLTDGGTVALPVLFLLGALLVLLLGAGFVRGWLAPTTVYLVGGVLMVGNLIAYADWHALQVADGVFGFEGYDHAHADPGHTGEDHGHDDGHSHAHDHDHNGGGHGHDDGHNDDAHGHDHNGDGHSHDGDGHDHDGSAYEGLTDHLRDDLTALATKVAETVSAMAFFALYILER